MHALSQAYVPHRNSWVQFINGVLLQMFNLRDYEQEKIRNKRSVKNILTGIRFTAIFTGTKTGTKTATLTKKFRHLPKFIHLHISVSQLKNNTFHHYQ